MSSDNSRVAAIFISCVPFWIELFHQGIKFIVCCYFLNTEILYMCPKKRKKIGHTWMPTMSGSTSWICFAIFAGPLSTLRPRFHVLNVINLIVSSCFSVIFCRSFGVRLSWIRGAASIWEMRNSRIGIRRTSRLDIFSS